MKIDGLGINECCVIESVRRVELFPVLKILIAISMLLQQAAFALSHSKTLLSKKKRLGSELDPKRFCYTQQNCTIPTGLKTNSGQFSIIYFMKLIFFDNLTPFEVIS